MIDLLNDGSGLGFGIIGGKSTGVVVKTILPGGVADKVSIDTHTLVHWVPRSLHLHTFHQLLLLSNVRHINKDSACFQHFCSSVENHDQTII